jgi:predicted nucleic acid-binding protein
VVDATVIAHAERVRERRIATLDRRHFGTIRPRHVPGFLLLP